MGLWIDYTNITEKCLPGNSKRFVFDGCRGGGSHLYGVVYIDPWPVIRVYRQL